MTALTLRTAALMEQFERRCERIERQCHALAEQLQQATAAVPEQARRSADATLHTLPDTVLRRLEAGLLQAGLEPPVAAYEQRLQHAGAQLQAGAHALAMQLRRMETLHRQLLWKFAATVIAALALLLAGGAWLGNHYRHELARQRLQADLLRAYNQADVTLCDGRLCARVEDGVRYGDYRPVRPR
nr:relaxation protein [Vulcaniibacterium gelatinicum]